jgi:hypothetical protein
MRRYVEHFPAVDIGFLRRRGLFGAQGACTVELDSVIGPLRFEYVHGASFLCATILHAPKGPTTCRIGLVVKQLRLGERAYFVCPIRKAPVTKLYVCNWTFGSREAHGLVHLSKSSTSGVAARGRAIHIAERLKGSAGRAPARGEKRRLLILELLQHVDLNTLDVETRQLITNTRLRDEGLSRSRTRLRLNDEVATKRAIARGRDPSFGWTEQKILQELDLPLRIAKEEAIAPLPAELPPDYVQDRPQLDVRVLKSEGLLQPGQLRGAALLWKKELMGVLTEVIAAFDLRDPERPLIFIRGRDTFFHQLYDQLVELIPCDGRWYLRCPISGSRVTILYLKEGRFASRSAQELFYRRPPPPKERGMSKNEFMAMLRGTSLR